MARPRILIIEDEKLIRWSLRQRFEEEDYHVEEAENATTGISKLAAGVYDLVMLDHKLPDLTGLDVLRRIREQDGDVVVLMMTAYSNVEDAVQAMRLGAYDYVSKPFKMEDLMLTVGKALETTRLKREAATCGPRCRRNSASTAFSAAAPPCSICSRSSATWPKAAHRPSFCEAKAAPARTSSPRPSITTPTASTAPS